MCLGGRVCFAVTVTHSPHQPPMPFAAALHRPRPAVTAAPTRRGRPARRLAALALVGAAAVAAACGGGTDPFAPRANFPTVRDTFALYALSSGQPLLPAALDLYTVRAVRPSLGGGTLPNFDFAVDRDGQGRVLLYPARVLASPSGGSPRVGFQVVATAFDALERAPNGGYRYDTVQVAAVGQTIAVESQGVTPQSLACGTSQPLYAKLVVDSAPATGGVFLRVHVDPNCGFRSFAAGIPTN